MFKTLLIAVDVDDLDNAAHLAEAAKVMSDDNANLHVITVVPEAGFAMVGMALGPDHASQIMQATSEQVAAWAKGALGDGAKTHVIQGSIYDAVLKTAESISADAIVVGAHRPALKDYLMGPNAARIVRHAQQSVFVVR